MVNSPDFTGTRALDLFHQRYTMDYGSGRHGARSYRSLTKHKEVQFNPTFYLDMITYIGRPMKAITGGSSDFFENVHVTFRHWRTSYQIKHAEGINFPLTQRTFCVAEASTRDKWFIVMHPKVSIMTELPESGSTPRQQRTKEQQQSAIAESHAVSLVTYIKKIFSYPRLVTLGVDSSWTLGGNQSQTVTFQEWSEFQKTFMAQWEQEMVEVNNDAFWHENHPAFHAYDYGANIEIHTTPSIQSLQRETPLDTSDDSSDMYSESDDDSWDISQLTSYNTLSQRSSVPVSSGSAVRGDMGSSDTMDTSDTTHLPPGLAELQRTLEKKYLIDHLESISYAFAINLECRPSPTTEDPAPEELCLLADFAHVRSQFTGSRPRLCLYPLGFNPGYGNFSCPEAPPFLANHVLTVCRHNMSVRNHGSQPLTCGYFQAYSNIKRLVRHSARSLLADKGITTAVVGMPSAEAARTPRLQKKRDHLLRHLHGELTADEPEASQPFARERQRVLACIDEGEHAYRMEQVLSVQISRLTPTNRTFTTILQPILQLMRFFWQQTADYASFLRFFPPEVFPGVLADYGMLFRTATQQIYRQAERCDRLEEFDLGLAEGAALLDRLGAYCFTGDARSLMPTVMGPIQVINSLRHQGWPFVDPAVLDLRGAHAALNWNRWPSSAEGPHLLHLAAIAHHFGPSVAYNRGSYITMLQLCHTSSYSLTAITAFVRRVFQDLWIPQMIQFIQHSIKRELATRPRAHQSTTTVDQRDRLLSDWATSPFPFSYRYAFI